MNEFKITAEYCDRTFEHGEISVERKDMNEWTVEIDSHLVISSADYEQLCEEIQEVIRKYCI